MTREEVTTVLAVLKAAYPHSFKDLSKRDAENMVQLWARMFANDSYEEVNAAVGALIATRTVGYSPTVGEIKEKLYANADANALTEQEAWAMVSRACRNGLYGYDREFEKLPPSIQRVIGSAAQIRAWAMMPEETVQSVVASNFMRSYRAKSAHEKEMAMLPTDIRKVLIGVSERLAIGAGRESEVADELPV